MLSRYIHLTDFITYVVDGRALSLFRLFGSEGAGFGVVIERALGKVGRRVNCGVAIPHTTIRLGTVIRG